MAPMALAYLRHLPHLTPQLVEACLVCLFHWLEEQVEEECRAGGMRTPVMATILTLIPQASSGVDWATRLQGLLAGRPRLRRSLPNTRLYLEWCHEQPGLKDLLPPNTCLSAEFVDFNPWQLPPPPPPTAAANLPRLTQLLLLKQD